ncbi:MAG: class II glutamine amidotransferase [Gammaproteobacteria bacterium]|nr:class II glutamine amidotransferase [Gammaproteobacteria bacterium]
MCRLLCVKANKAFEIRPHLKIFAEIARRSKEYQGHGWGCAWLQGGQWKVYHNINPIWKDDLGQFDRSPLLIAHARSAFRDEGICVENNMPFFDGHTMFMFNGELRGVRIKEHGRIGAEKIFNYVKRFNHGDMLRALERGVSVIKKKTRYIRAMNIVMADTNKVYLSTLFNEDPEYFQMWSKRAGDMQLICSEAYPGESRWNACHNGTIEAF